LGYRSAEVRADLCPDRRAIVSVENSSVSNLSLFDVLVGCFPSEWPAPLGDPDQTAFEDLEQLPDQQQLRMSIAENLKMVLQSRRGSVTHLPQFGLPDVIKSYLDADRKIDPLVEQIRETILRFEPRIVQVKGERKFDENYFRLALRLTALIKNLPDSEVLLTEFSSTGWTRLIFERDAE
jgi:type VI secretion system protein